MARQFYFAWVDQGEAFSIAHHRYDENVFSLRVSHAEGEFASAVVTIENPRAGLLNAARKQWVWLSLDTDATAGVVPLIYGRLVGIPSRLEAETLDLTFIARPPTYEAAKTALADGMKIAPYYDDIWITPDRRDDPDAVLEFYPSRWHIDRIDHAVTASDMIVGEDGTVDFDTAILEGSLDVSITQTPLRKLLVEAELSWNQLATGFVDVSDNLVEVAHAAGTTTKNAISSMTGDGLAKDWPVEGDSIGQGWTVGQASVTRMDGTVVPPTYVTTFLSYGHQRVLEVNLLPHLECAYDVSRRRLERVSFTMDADVQPVLTEPGDEEVMLVSLASGDVGAPIDPADTANPDGTLPIGDTRRRQYLTTDRGRRSFESLLAYARARLLTRSRAVDVRFVVPFDQGLTLSCRQSGRIVHDDLPGGEATGKITFYEMRLDGATGEAVCEIVISATIGNGNTVAAAAGTPELVENDTFEPFVPGIQNYIGAVVMPITGVMTYDDYTVTEPVDDGIDFFTLDADAAIERLEIINGVTAQKAVLAQLFFDANAAIEALKAIPTEFDMDLVTLTGGPFETAYSITVSDLMVPKTIDLQAAP